MRTRSETQLTSHDSSWFRLLTAGLNRRTSVTDPNGVQTVTGYDPLSRVFDAADCSCCDVIDLARELAQIKNFMRTNGHNYRKPWWPPGRLFSYGCGDAADAAAADLENTFKPKCWISRSQMLAPGHIVVLETYVVVHFVPTFRPCRASSPADDLQSDPFNGSDELRPAQTGQWVDDLYCPAERPRAHRLF